MTPAAELVDAAGAGPLPCLELVSGDAEPVWDDLTS